MLTTKRGYRLPEFKIMGNRIELMDNIKYLGVVLHKVLGFKAHVKAAVTPERIIPCMLKRRRNWDAVRDFVNTVQSTRENEERERQRNQN